MVIRIELEASEWATIMRQLGATMVYNQAAPLLEKMRQGMVAGQALPPADPPPAEPPNGAGS
jgi:hypothetical protein